MFLQTRDTTMEAQPSAFDSADGTTASNISQEIAQQALRDIYLGAATTCCNSTTIPSGLKVEQQDSLAQTVCPQVLIKEESVEPWESDLFAAFSTCPLGQEVIKENVDSICCLDDNSITPSFLALLAEESLAFGSTSDMNATPGPTEKQELSTDNIASESQSPDKPSIDQQICPETEFTQTYSKKVSKKRVSRIPKRRTRRSRTQSASKVRTNNLTRIARSTLTTRKDYENKLLLQLRDQGLQYREIKRMGKFNVSISTLRGRYRTLVKKKEQRVRKPEWTPKDVVLLKAAVRELAPEALHARNSSHIKLPCKKMAGYIVKHGGSYDFGAGTIKKKWTEVFSTRSTGRD